MTKLNEKDSAIVYDFDKDELLLSLPKEENRGQEAKQMEVLLIALYQRLYDDPEWVQELFEWFDKKMQETLDSVPNQDNS